MHKIETRACIKNLRNSSLPYDSANKYRKWLCLILTEIFTSKKREVENIIFMFVACLYIREFRHIENRYVNG